MSDNTPLLAQPPDYNHSDDREESLADGLRSHVHRARALTQHFFSSRAKHWVVLTLIVLDVAGILTDIFIGVITCELNREDEPWVAPARHGLMTLSLVMSCIFMVELALSVFAYGLAFFSSWFHRLDAFIIVGSFAVDLLEHGVAEEIVSLIVVLRLWRFIKIVQEFSVEQSEQTEALRRRIEELENQMADLESQRAER